MSNQNNSDNKVSSSVPFVPTKKGRKSRMKEAIDKKEHLRENLYVNAHKQVEVYQKAFEKKGHNILENMKVEKLKNKIKNLEKKIKEKK